MRAIFVGGKLKMRSEGGPRGLRYLRGDSGQDKKRDGRKAVSTESDMSAVYVYQLQSMDVA